MSDDLRSVTDGITMLKQHFSRVERLRFQLSKPFFYIGLLLMPSAVTDFAVDAMAGEAESGPETDDSEESDNYFDYIGDDQ